MRNPVIWFSLIVLIAVGGGFYFWKEKTDQEAHLEQVPAGKAEVAEPAQPASQDPEVVHPLPQEPPQAQSAPRKPLPPLNASDDTLREALTEPLGRQTLNDIVISKDMARRIVATIDNLPRKKIAERLLPIKPPGGQFATSGQGEIVTLNPSNYARYARYVKLAQTVDTKQLVAIYVHYYPLFQQAYRELGYPKKEFNDRVVQAIDDLLAAPEAPQPLELVRPKVLYEFEDPALEDLSAGRKIMLRIGPENALTMKAKLRDIRRELVMEAR